MSRFFIKGLDGKKTIAGDLPVRGGKNSVLKVQAASLLFRDSIFISNAPHIEDVKKANGLLEDLGVSVERKGDRSFLLKPSKNINSDLNGEIAKSLRSSIVFTGPILAREGSVSFPHPGGCVIGQRPIDLFLSAFKKMGATEKFSRRGYFLKAKKLKPADIFLKIPSVTATETLMMTAVLLKGTTILRNCACEPEIVSLADFLNSSGALIEGAGTHTIVVRGRGKLLSKGFFKTPADRIEAGSFAAIAAVCGKGVRITNCEPTWLRAPLCGLREMGVEMKEGKDFIFVKPVKKLKAVNMKTREYPGFPTDLQAPFSVVLTQAEGRSMIFETVFEGRLAYLNDLARMGADIVVCDPHRAIIIGPKTLRGREMESPDLRAGLAFLMAAMLANGDSILDNIYNIDRGYEKIEERLNNVGADIKRID